MCDIDEWATRHLNSETEFIRSNDRTAIAYILASSRCKRVIRSDDWFRRRRLVELNEVIICQSFHFSSSIVNCLCGWVSVCASDFVLANQLPLLNNISNLRLFDSGTQDHILRDANANCSLTADCRWTFGRTNEWMNEWVKKRTSEIIKSNYSETDLRQTKRQTHSRTRKKNLRREKSNGNDDGWSSAPASPATAPASMEKKTIKK